MTTRDTKGSCSASSLPEQNSSLVDFFNNKRPNKQQQQEV